MRLLLLSMLLSVAFAVDMELVPGLGYYWVPKIFTNISVQYRWDESMSSCVFEGGHLAVINSQEEAEFLATLLQRDADTPYGHVGFSDLFVEGHYMTVNDEPLSAAGYSAWASGYPNGGTTSNCGAINRKGELMDIDCYSIQTPLCEKEIWTGYDLVSGLGYYKFFDNEVTWGSALELCHQEGSSLAVINSDEEAKVIAALFEGFSTQGCNSYLTCKSVLTRFLQLGSYINETNWRRDNAGVLWNILLCTEINDCHMFIMRLLLFPLLFSVAFAVKKELVPGLGYYWIPKILNNVSVQYRWDESMSSCYYEGGHLAVINSKEEAEILAKLLESEADTPLGHIGFSDLLLEGEFMTVIDEPLSGTGYSVWASGYPNGTATNNCGAINRKGELMDIDCYAIQTPLCEAEIWTGYDLVPEMGYYKFYDEKVKWGEALERCHHEGSTLAVINSDEEAKVIAALFEGHEDAQLAHVGIQDRFPNSEFWLQQMDSEPASQELCHQFCGSGQSGALPYGNRR
ncbi:hypothetical protein C0J52_12831 [Blattella germanica]|nr:hypothetical protein C0J52_12831 [Blattella germanica]